MIELNGKRVGEKGEFTVESGKSTAGAGERGRTGGMGSFLGDRLPERAGCLEEAERTVELRGSKHDRW